MARPRLEEKLARWLLMAHDRIDGDELPLIHEFLAVMLGVHRPGVTLALSHLEGRGVITAKRSNITVIDRKGLEEIGQLLLRRAGGRIRQANGGADSLTM